MSDAAEPRTLLRKPKVIDFKKVLAILHESNIIDANFTGDLHFSINRGGVASCKKVETIK